MPDPWFALELAEHVSENVDPREVDDAIRRTLRQPKQAEIWLPVHEYITQGVRSWRWLAVSYVFIRDVTPEALHRLRNNDHKLLGKVVPGLVPDRDVAKLRQQTRAQTADLTIRVGDTVLMLTGVLSRIPAIVIAELPETDSLSVSIRLRSMEILATTPRAAVSLVTKAAVDAQKSSPEPVSLQETSGEPEKVQEQASDAQKTSDDLDPHLTALCDAFYHAVGAVDPSDLVDFIEAMLADAQAYARDATNQAVPPRFTY